MKIKVINTDLSFQIYSLSSQLKFDYELLKIRVRPYYLYQCDLIHGSKHFRTSVEEGIKIGFYFSVWI